MPKTDKALNAAAEAAPAKPARKTAAKSKSAAAAAQPEAAPATPAKPKTVKAKAAAKPAATPAKKSASKAAPKAAAKAKAAPAAPPQPEAAPAKPATLQKSVRTTGARNQESQPVPEAPPAPPQPAPVAQTVRTTGSRAQASPAVPPASIAPAPKPVTTPAEPRVHVEAEEQFPAITLDELPPAMRNAVIAMGWPSLSPVQSRAIPYVLAGRHMMVQSRTGSGKTGAFGLPMLARLDAQRKAAQALVLVPTRELAQQVTREIEALARGAQSTLAVVGVYGGVAYGPQLDALHAGAQIVVGTPGRILDHLLRGSLKLNALRILIFDEADRMLSMGFYPDMKAIDRYLPRPRDGYMFSATFPMSVRRLASQFLERPGFLSLSHDAVQADNTDHIVYETPQMDKDRALVRIIEVENPESAIIFCNTKVRVNYVATVLQRFGYDADQLSADLSQGMRDQVLDRLRRHQLRFLVATDIAGRGIDISALSHVINYEPPDDVESYIHRTGRTGRAGASGIAINLVGGPERNLLDRIAKRYHIEMEARPLPSDFDVANLVAERLTVHLEAHRRNRDRLMVERMQRLAPLARTLSESTEGLELLTMMLDDYYQQLLHAAPEVPEEDRPRRPAPQPAPVSRSGEAPDKNRNRRRRSRH